MDDKAYLAGQISGLTYAEARAWRFDVARQLDSRVLDPMRGMEDLIGAGRISCKCTVETVERAYRDVANCKVLLVNLLGTLSVSRGTLVEIGVAWTLGKIIVVVMEEGNVHDHPFVTEPATYVVDNLDEAIELVKAVLA